MTAPATASATAAGIAGETGEGAARHWLDVNRACLDAELDGLWRLVEAVERGADGPSRLPDPPAADAVPGGGAADRIAARFGLGRFERAVLMLAAGPDLASAAAPPGGPAAGPPPRPTFGRLLATLPEAHWSALAPEAPLRRFRLIALGPGDGLSRRPLHAAEVVLHYLNGLVQDGPALAPHARPLAPDPVIAEAYGDVVARAAEAVAAAAARHGPPVLRLTGPDRAVAEGVATAVLGRLGLAPRAFRPAALAGLTVEEAEDLAAAWRRDARLHDLAAVLAEAPPAGPAAPSLLRFVEAVDGALAIAESSLPVPATRPVVEIAVPPADADRREALWRAALGPDAAARAGGRLADLAFAFPLDAGSIRAIGREAADGSAEAWALARARARRDVTGLAERIDARATLDDLVLPDDAMAVLAAIRAQLRQRQRVLADWGFGAMAGRRGGGVSALFAGESGTGKTLAAEALAGELGIDLFRIDLSAVISKYIGETEKNLETLFRAAEASGAGLVFDEADACFGKRTEVRDSHDRYANQEVSYLLQRLERFAGLAVLTTNQPDALDDAFQRRLTFVLRFPLPGPAERARLWARAFPPGAPTEGLNFDKLARLSVAGGAIHNIALQAAYGAAEAGTPITMAAILEATRAEFAKRERTVTEAEVRGWA